ncbi:hypothetical protein [Haemophilus paraphrohaemolyticus]|uniref:hypothetical protein n=1 Tax=Haemophilus paraphrohaemolyticus TaxID=736 RepID=UPI000587EDA7|nr:hypothetical protein [Haemophilus paraphrohaemolyticus]OOR94255.1 hypothetical protein B0184_08295 [Haemophilus paraphrohaemolyticus]
MNWNDIINASNSIALCAMLYTIVGVRQSRLFAKRAEDKVLVDSLLQILSEMENLSSHFFLSDRRERADTHYYSTCFLTKLNIAIHITKILHEKRNILQENIYEHFSKFHWYATVDIESINAKTSEQNAGQYKNINQAYLKCIVDIYNAFEEKYSKNSFLGKFS